MDTLKGAAANVGNKLSQVTGAGQPSSEKEAAANVVDQLSNVTGSALHSGQEGAHQSDKVETAGTSPKEQAVGLISSLEKLGPKPTGN